MAQITNQEVQAETAGRAFQPYVAPEDRRAEFTPRAVIVGGLFGILFGAVTVYVGLRAGLTVSASIPIAVLSISLLRALGKATILENNIVQTTGSAGESVAGGVIFTLPALIFLGFPLEYQRIFFLALIGGWLGVFFMIPLRRQLIVKEHGNLLYPEGTACADVLIAGDKGGSFASRVFAGLGIGALYTAFQNENIFGLWPSTPDYQPKWYPGSAIRANTTSEYLGVGYIIGPRIAGVIFAGGVFAWLVVMPAIRFFGGHLTIYPGTVPVDTMSPSQLWGTYIRPMGAGAVAAAGVITLAKTVPTIVSALRAGASDLKRGATAAVGRLRTEDDMSLKFALAGTVVLLIAMVLMLTLKPIPGAYTSMAANILAAVFVVIFGFLFVTVSSRITGLIGSSSNPISGMAIATMMAVAVLFLIAGASTLAYSALVIAIGGVVCIASANAGNTSQDLKTGFLVGATPRNQQKGLLVGVLVSVFAIGITLKLMNRGLESIRSIQPIPVNIGALPEGVRVIGDQENELLQRHESLQLVDEKNHPTGQTIRPENYKLISALGSSVIPNGQYLYNPASQQIEVQWQQGIGSAQAAAPQANLMATVVNGILTHRLPWNLVLIGVFIVIGVELLGIRSLSFAVGFYLSIATTLAIFTGGIVRWLVEVSAKRHGEVQEESDVSPGSLFASGLIAAGGVVGLLGIAIKVGETTNVHGHPLIPPGMIEFGQKLPTAGWNWLGVVMFALLAYALFHFARKPIQSGEEMPIK